MANFIGLVYATLKEEGIDTKGMSTDEAVAKYNELQGKDGGKAGKKEGTPAEEKRMEEKGILDEKQLKLLPKMKTEHLKESIEWFEGLYEKHKDKESGEQIKRFIDAYKEELNKRKTVKKESPDDVKKKLNGEKKESKEEQKPEDVKNKLNGEKQKEEKAEGSDIEEGKKDWVKTAEDEEVWNSLTDDEKKLLTYSSDMGFWYDEILGNDEIKEKYDDLSAKFSRSKKESPEDVKKKLGGDNYL